MVNQTLTLQRVGPPQRIDSKILAREIDAPQELGSSFSMPETVLYDGRTQGAIPMKRRLAARRSGSSSFASFTWRDETAP